MVCKLVPSALMTSTLRMLNCESRAATKANCWLSGDQTGVDRIFNWLMVRKLVPSAFSRWSPFPYSVQAIVWPLGDQLMDPVQSIW